jgi:DNA-binding transcriptional MerR regulator
MLHPRASKALTEHEETQQASQRQETTLRIDDLAHETGIASRTIRFYNTQGLLPPPVMRGRVAYYSREHVLVLQLVKELKERQHLPLELIKQLLEIRAIQGEMQMNQALKQLLLRSLTSGSSQVQLSREELMQQTGATLELIEELLRLGLIFPVKIGANTYFSGDDVLLIQLYQQFEQLRLPLALPALIRFQLRQLVRSERAAYEQYIVPRWRDDAVPFEDQARQFEEMLALSDTLIAILHRKLMEQR